MARLYNARSGHIERWVVPAARELLIREACKDVPTKLLKEIAVIEMGQSPESDSVIVDGIGTPFIGGPTDLGIEFPETSRWTTTPTKLCQPNDIIVCVRATIGEPRWADGIYCLGRGVAGIRPKDSSIDRKILFRIIQANERLLFEKGTGTTFKTISKEHLAGIIVPMLSPETQRMIGNYLEWLETHSIVRPNFDEAPKLPDFLQNVSVTVGRIEALAARVAEAQSLRRKADKETGILFLAGARRSIGDPRTNPFGWEQKKLGLISDTRYGISAPVSQAKDSAFGMPIIRMANIDLEGNLDLSDLSYYNASEVEKTTFAVKQGDLLLNWRSGSQKHVGKTALFDKDGEFVFASFLLRIRADLDVISPEYLKIVINFMRADGIFLDAQRFQVNTKLNAKEFAEFPIMVPPLEVQRRLVAYLDGLQTQIEKLHRLQSESQKELDALLPSILDKAFKGEL